MPYAAPDRRVIRFTESEGIQMKPRVLVALALLAALAGCRPPSPPSEQPQQPPAEKYPPVGFSVPSLQPGTETIALGDFKGKVVLLDFWATWCPPCRSEIPSLKKLHDELKDRGFSMVGMNVDQGSPQEVAEAVKRFEITYPLGLAGPEVQAAYGGIRAVPTKFLLDREGAIRKNYVGVVPEKDLRADIESLLAN
jgi:thiol-disulfide isomerase/thioredoxin